MGSFINHLKIIILSITHDCILYSHEKSLAGVHKAKEQLQSVLTKVPKVHTELGEKKL